MERVISVKTLNELVSRDCLTAEQVTSEIWKIFKLPQFRKSSAADIADETERKYLNQIQDFIKHDEPIRIVLIAFPWKMWRMPLKTNRKTPDFGEYAFLLQVKRMNELVRRVYAPGTHWTFLTEGGAYQDLFDVPEAEAAQYVSRIQDFAHMLGIAHNVSFIPLHSILNRYSEFPLRVEEVHARLSKEYPTNNGTIPHTFRSFFGTFYTSQDMRQISIGTLRKIYHQGSADTYQLSSSEEELTEKTGNTAKQMVLKYIAFNEAKHLVGTGGAIHDSFPEHLYISITQKPGRYTLFPVHPKAKLLPHHGVPVVRKDGRITIEWLDSVMHTQEPFVPVFLDGDIENLPFFYEEV